MNTSHAQLIAYIRVSSVGQSLEVQRDKAQAAGVHPDNIFAEKASGTNTGRPELKACLRSLRKGDTLVITKIDRLARSAVDLLNIVEELKRKGAALRVLDQSIDTSTPAGHAMLQMLAVFAEFETAIRAERQMDGIAKAKADGVKFGRASKQTAEVVDKVRAMRAEGSTIGAIVAATGLSRATVYRALGEAEAA